MSGYAYAPLSPYVSLNSLLYPKRTYRPWSRFVMPVAAVLATVSIAAATVIALHPAGASTSAASLFDLPLDESAPATSGPGVLVTSAAGHFAARFGARPIESRLPDLTVGAITVSTHTANDAADLTVVSTLDVSTTMSASSQRMFLDGLLHGMSSGGARIVQTRRTTFHGHPAVEATMLVPSGLTLDCLAVTYGPHRGYLLSAPDGGLARTLFASFSAA